MPFCTQCGQQVNQFDAVCPRCGTNQTLVMEIPQCVLIEHEEEGVRELMSSLLMRAGYECRVAETLDGLVYLYSVLPRLDLVCCGIDSFESLAVAERAPSPAPAPPVIVCVPTLDGTLITKALEMGACDVLFRPVIREQLLFSVRRALRYRRLRLENLYFRDKLHVGSGIEMPCSLLMGRWR